MQDDDEDDTDVGDEPGAGNGRTLGPIMLELAESAVDDFETRRIFSVVRQRLLGGDEPLYIDRERFRVLRRLGAGGMGEVYLCADEELHRNVAVKLVRGTASPREQARLLREAQALAKLSHANVVPIFDIGMHADRTFLAMEYVEGQTLAKWLRSRQPWREVLSRFILAGRGLAAAHRAGLVHRDFKPDNVLLGPDGSVKVADFGLALDDGPADTPRFAVPSLQPTITSTHGSVAGTTRYMSLEQLRGRGVDARSDQFSFCVALYEGLWGEPPFIDTDTQTRIAALERGQPKPPRTAHGLWPVILRGLAREPEQRWPNMTALLDALERVPRRRRRLAQAAVAMTGALGLVVVTVQFVQATNDVCDDVELGAWPEQRQRLEKQFATLSDAHVPNSSRLVLGKLDAWVHAWEDEQALACQLQRGQTSPHDTCLARQRQVFDDVVDILASGNSARLADAVGALEELPTPSSCADPRTHEPPHLAAAADMVGVQIDRARTLRSVGDLDRAYAAAVFVTRIADELGHAPAQADALTELAKIVDVQHQPLRAAKLYDEAIHLAEVIYLDRLVAELLIERTELSLYELDQHEKGEAQLERAQTAVERAGKHDDATKARLEHLTGRVAEHQGDDAAAKHHYDQAVKLARAAARADLPTYLAALARVTEGGDKQALEREWLEVASEQWGPQHPRFHLALAVRALERDDLDAAERHAHALADAQARVLPEYLPDRGEPHQLLATIEGVRGDHPERAMEHARKALQYFGTDDDRAPSMRQVLVDSLLALGEIDAAALELQQLAGLISDAPHERAALYIQQAEVAVRRGQLDEADQHLRAISALPGVDLAGRELTYELLRALVDLRRAQLEPAQLERVKQARVKTLFTAKQLEDWFEQLELTPAEREQLGL